jgi:hypothetical protein
LTVTPSDGFNHAVTFSCSGLPSGAACSFAPDSVTPDGSALKTTLTISTAAATARNLPWPGSWPPGELLLAGLSVPVLLRRRAGVRRRASRRVLALWLFGAAILAGCGGGNSGGGSGGSLGTPAGTYTVAISATGGSTSHTVDYTLTVT